MGWDTGSMVRRPPNPLDAQQRRTIQQLSGTMASAGTPISAPNYNFGSGIRLPPASPSSQAIASFVNLPGGSQPQTPQIPQAPQLPQTPQAPAPYTPAPRGGGAGNTGNQQRANWWAAVNAVGQPSSSIAQTQPTDHADYVQKFNAMTQYAQGQGMSPEDTQAYGSRLNQQGLLTYGGGDPAAAYAKWQAEQQAAKQAMVAQAAAGSTNWVSGG